MELSQTISQSQKQIQSQRLSQRQILAMKLLSLSSSDLVDEAYEFAEKNPALEVGDAPRRRAQKKPSADFQRIIDNAVDERKTLDEHLKFQLNAMRISDDERALAVKLVENLDSNGFHILSPLSFLDRDNPAHTASFLNQVLSIIQSLDPVGVCVKDVPESLLVQARERERPNALALFILDGHFDFLDPPKAGKIQKKLKEFLSAQKKLRAYSAEKSVVSALADISEEAVSAALSFIRTLDPHPARDFGAGAASGVPIDAVVKCAGEKIAVEFPKDDFPALSISGEYARLSQKQAASERERANVQFARQSVAEASAFIESISYRRTAVQRAALEIARRQFSFFERGFGHLKPFLQKELAKTLGVHEATVSRIASGKFLACDWGVFPFSFFFTSAVAESAPQTGRRGAETGGAASKESVQFEISRILKAHESDEKPLSDQKISGLLAEKGIRVARRTVAKYRAALNLGSSYER